MKKIFSAIDEYATVYSKLEVLQESHKRLLPKGDQKTGVIAEFYARLYARKIFDGAELIYGSTSEHAWDIIVRRVDHDDHKIQVKAVSAHSTTSRVSVIHPGWNELYLIRLNEHLYPEGFWTLLADSADWSTERLASTTMPRHDIDGSGSRVFHSATDRLQNLLDTLKTAKNISLQLA